MRVHKAHSSFLYLSAVSIRDSKFLYSLSVSWFTHSSVWYKYTIASLCITHLFTFFVFVTLSPIHTLTPHTPHIGGNKANQHILIGLLMLIFNNNNNNNNNKKKKKKKKLYLRLAESLMFLLSPPLLVFRFRYTLFLLLLFGFSSHFSFFFSVIFFFFSL